MLKLYPTDIDLRAVGTLAARRVIPLLSGGEYQHGHDEHAKALEPQDQKSLHDHTPISASIGGATAPASR